MANQFQIEYRIGTGLWTALTTSSDISLALSDFISNSGADTTSDLLTPPAGMTSVDFQAGYVSDDVNPVPAINLVAGKYTEIEFNAEIDAAIAAGDVIEFRITDNGVVLDTYSVTPQITAESASGTAQTITGVSAESLSEATAGTVTANKKVELTGIPAESKSEAFAGTVINDSSISQAILGVSAESLSEAGSGTLIVGSVITGVSAESVSEAPVGTVTANKQMLVTGVPAESVSEAIPGTVQGGSSQTITGIPAESKSEAIPGITLSGIIVRGPPAESLSEAAAGQITIGIISTGVSAESLSEATAGRFFNGKVLSRPILNKSINKLTTTFALNQINKQYSINKITTSTSINKIT